MRNCSHVPVFGLFSNASREHAVNEILAPGYSPLVTYVAPHSLMAENFSLPWKTPRSDADLIAVMRYELNYGSVVAAASFSEIDPIDVVTFFYEDITWGAAGNQRHEYTVLSGIGERDERFTAEGCRRTIRDIADAYLIKHHGSEVFDPAPDAKRRWQLFKSLDGEYSRYGDIRVTNEYFVGTEEEIIERCQGTRYLYREGTLI